MQLPPNFLQDGPELILSTLIQSLCHLEEKSESPSQQFPWESIHFNSNCNQHWSFMDVGCIKESFSQSIIAFNPQLQQYHFTCWPNNCKSPGLHLTWEYNDDHALLNQWTFGAELLPFFMDEDDAFDWHSSCRSLCIEVGIDHERAKEEADKFSFSSSGTSGYLGIGGIRQIFTLENEEICCQVFATAIRKLIPTYINLIKRHTHEERLSKMVSNGEVEESTSFRLESRDSRPLPRQLTPEEMDWVSYRRGHLVQALRNANVPVSCAPCGEVKFFCTSDGLPNENEIPRRARSLFNVLRKSPRPTYLETLFVQAIRGVSVPRPPVWLHRQAGRYLPEYRQVKGDKSFLEMTGDPRIASEITLQPVLRYNVDCAIIFSDIMTIPQALGMELLMQPGPVFPHPLRTYEDIKMLKYNPEVLKDVYKALEITRSQLPSDKALVGFCGAPWTLMAYMVGKDLAKKWLHMNPEWSHEILQKCTDVAVDYLCKQIDAGADVVQVFESNAVDLGPFDFNVFSFPYLKEIAIRVKEQHPHIPMTVFPRGANYCIQKLAEETKYDTISVDWGIHPNEARKAAGEFVTLQGNLEPDVMYEPVDNVRSKTRKMIQDFGKYKYIVNLGHGTKPDMHPDAVGAFVEEAQTITIGSRNSPLAMAQAEITKRELQNCNSQDAHNFRIDGVMTKGDKVLDVALSKIGDKGLFTKELEVSLQSGEVAIVQHSLKDLETSQPIGLILGATLKRGDRRDALISRKGDMFTLDSLPIGATVGTSSLRRRAQLLSLRPDLRIEDVRGNLNTRIMKLLGKHPQTSDHYDAIVLAMAGIERLSSSNEGALDSGIHVEPLSACIFVPAVSQGAIGIQSRCRDYGIHRILQAVNDLDTQTETFHERSFLRTLEGGCQVPFGAITSIDLETKQLTIEGHVWSIDGKVHLSAVGNSGTNVAKDLDLMGATQLVDEARNPKLV
jgi:uroporphyrinogen decarboxylase